MAKVLNEYFASVFIVEDTYEIKEIIPSQPNLIPSSNGDFIVDVVIKNNS